MIEDTYRWQQVDDLRAQLQQAQEDNKALKRRMGKAGWETALLLRRAEAQVARLGEGNAALAAALARDHTTGRCSWCLGDILKWPDQHENAGFWYCENTPKRSCPHDDWRPDDCWICAALSDTAGEGWLEEQV